ncbi:MAG: hypothetical protein PHI13_12875 [Methylococcales bacterium]|nr:hypothetical protein [Methylococcales bacterium]
MFAKRCNPTQLKLGGKQDEWSGGADRLFPQVILDGDHRSDDVVAIGDEEPADFVDRGEPLSRQLDSLRKLTRRGGHSTANYERDPWRKCECACYLPVPVGCNFEHTKRCPRSRYLWWGIVCPAMGTEAPV